MKITVIEIKHYQLIVLVKNLNKTILNLRPYLKDIINNPKKSDTQKIQLTIANNFTSSEDNDEEHLMHSKSNNTEVMIDDNADEVIEKLFESLLNRYQTRLGPLMSGCDFIFVSFH